MQLMAQTGSFEVTLADQLNMHWFFIIISSLKGCIIN